MKKRLLDFLVCPQCEEPLHLQVSAEDGREIKEGELTCRKCGKTYPIRNFIPRFVENDNYVDTFSFEWSKFHDVQMDILNKTDQSEKAFAWETGWKPGDIQGKLLLDVGVGAGRFADIASKWGGEVIGIDLSFAADVAFKNIGQRDKVHIIQADIFRLPFRREIFDHMYSLGVLHHTPDTRAAFKAITPYLKRDGSLAVFLYAYGHYHFFSDIWRKITTHLPLRHVYYLSSLAVPLYYIHKIPLFGLTAQFLLPTSNWPHRRWRWLDTFDWYTPKYQWKHTWPEVYAWFREEGFTNIALNENTRDTSLQQICMRGRKTEEEAQSKSGSDQDHADDRRK